MGIGRGFMYACKLNILHSEPMFYEFCSHLTILSVGVSVIIIIINNVWIERRFSSVYFVSIIFIVRSTTLEFFTRNRHAPQASRYNRKVPTRERLRVSR